MTTLEEPPLYFGRHPNDPQKPRARLRRLVGGPAITSPPAVHWLGAALDWGMLGNDTCGDCTIAGAAHAEMFLAYFGRGDTLTFTTDECVSVYEQLSGYTPSDPNTDVGLTLQDALGFWRSTGIGAEGAREKILAFAQIDVTDHELIKACIALFGCLYAGFNVPRSAITQFRAGQRWTRQNSSPIVGGHCVPIGGYVASGPNAGPECVTWGKVQSMTWGFFGRYFDELWVPFTDVWLSRNGARTPGGLDVEALNAQILALTGTPGPFVQPTPPLVPPDMSADTLLHSLFGQIDAWMRSQGK